MAEAGRAGGLQPPAGPSREELEERWKEAVDVLAERPRDPELLVKAGQLSEQLDRRPEAWTYYQKALTLDPSKAFLIPKLRGLAVTDQQKADVAKMSGRPTSFAAGLSDIFKYPVRGKGLPVLIMGALFVWIGRTLAVTEALVPTILEQRVTGGQARRSWRLLVRRLGEPAPGPLRATSARRS